MFLASCFLTSQEPNFPSPLSINVFLTLVIPLRPQPQAESHATSTSWQKASYALDTEPLRNASES